MELKVTFQWFKSNHDAIFAEYPNKYIGLQDSKVIFSADTYEEALAVADSMGLIPGTYLIQECTEGENAYTQMFSSFIAFA